MTDQALLSLQSKDAISMSSQSSDSGLGDQRPYRPQELKKIHKNRWELRSVVAIFRHGDRTPKQKMKMRTKDACFLKFFDGKPNIKKDVKLKTPRELQVSPQLFSLLVETLGSDQALAGSDS